MNKVYEYIKKGKIEEALRFLDGLASQGNIDKEVMNDLAVLQGNFSELNRQEKRRQISAREARESRVSLIYELTELVDALGDALAFGDGDLNNQVQPMAQPMAPPQVNQQPAPVIVQTHVDVNIDISNSITNEIKNEIMSLEQVLGQMRQLMQDSGVKLEDEEQKHLQAVETDLAALAQAKDKEQVKGRLAKISDFINRLQEGNDTLGKVITTTKQGIKVAGNLIDTYNNIAQWVGLPVVPKLFRASQS